MSNLNAFHGYNLFYSFLGLVPSPSPPVSASVLSFHVLVHLHHITISAFVLLFYSRFHLPILQFQLLFSLLTTASLSSFLFSHLYKYWCKLSGSVEVFLYPNSFCALFFCLMVFSPFYICFCLFHDVVWMVVTLHFLSKPFLFGCWICYHVSLFFFTTLWMVPLL